MATSIFTRKLDLLYLVYFSTHIPVMFLMDLQALYPPSLTPTFLTSIKNFYITTYNDQFFISPPIYFQLFIWLELLVHVPVSFWAIGGLLRDSPQTPLVLLPYSFEVFLTTLICIHEYLYWPLSPRQKLDLTTLYGPYILLSTIMCIDMYKRLSHFINTHSTKSNIDINTNTKNQHATKKEYLINISHHHLTSPRISSKHAYRSRVHTNQTFKTPLNQSKPSPARASPLGSPLIGA
ncbi:hypothetical protein DID88_009244 [Monilinia fructigena]|uniref:EXPERA domain-containing protein n=1 Tax=Monilinia fructigena TaxID=38457 RepID=A0A395IHY4_9HELO|nr:hypothetical protein DID88_009244 [Monilinia fructigena]